LDVLEGGADPLTEQYPCAAVIMFWVPSSHNAALLGVTCQPLGPCQ
jgi:hypothetical protein